MDISIVIRQQDRIVWVNQWLQFVYGARGGKVNGDVHDEDVRRRSSSGLAFIACAIDTVRHHVPRY
jgi:hypothetical protein